MAGRCIKESLVLMVKRKDRFVMSILAEKNKESDRGQDLRRTQEV